MIEPRDAAPAETSAQIQTLHIQGMTCAACQSHVQRALQAVPGVTTAHVNLLAHRAEVQTRAPVPPHSLIAAVQSAGYSASVQAPPAMSMEAPHLGLRTLLALLAGVIAMTLSMPLMSATPSSSDPLLAFAATHLTTVMPAWLMALPAQPIRWLLAALALATMLFAAPGIYTAAWRAARHRATNMNTLVALGTLTAFSASLAAVLAPASLARHGLSADVYFEAVILILAFLLAGRWLEARARARATSALEAFAQLEANDVRLLTPAEGEDPTTAAETILPADALETGDLLRILAGERIPVDGLIVAGRSAIDVSMLTGEPLPITRSTGDNVQAGTVSLDGVIVVRATAVGAASTLAQMRRLLEQAQSSRAPLEALADRASAIFVPAVLALTALAFVIWSIALNTGAHPQGFAKPLAIAVAVLIIACPCAMGLAIPAAITVAIGRAAQLGLLIKGGEALERLARVDTLALDKTGTLTEGKPRIHTITLALDAHFDRAQLLAWAAACERLSTHPLANAVVAFATSGSAPSDIAIANLKVLPGTGVEADADGHHLRLGNASLLPLNSSTIAAPHDIPHATPLYLIVDDQLEAALFAVDNLREHAAEAISLTRSLGIQPLMLTGDIAASAQPIADAAGITDIRAGLLPQDKLSAIRTLQQQGRLVAMAGDGINDAAALAQADCGLALAGGTDLAREAGDALLLRPDLRLLPRAIQLARRTTRIMRQNLGWAFAYNALGLPIAAGALYPHFHILLSPVLASAAMALSSVSVLANSLRLRRA